jgi:hypothetical protein
MQIGYILQGGCLKSKRRPLLFQTADEDLFFVYAILVAIVLIMILQHLYLPIITLTAIYLHIVLRLRYFLPLFL